MQTSVRPSLLTEQHSRGELEDADEAWLSHSSTGDVSSDDAPSDMSQVSHSDGDSERGPDGGLYTARHANAECGAACWGLVGSSQRPHVEEYAEMCGVPTY